MSHVTTVTLPAPTTALFDFPVVLVPSNAVGWADFWSTIVDGGGDVRAYLEDDTTQLPREVVSCVVSTESGEIHVLVDWLSAAAPTAIHIHADGVSSEPAADSAYGSEAVWSGYSAVYHFAEGAGNTQIDSTGNGLDLTTFSGTSSVISGPLGSALEIETGELSATGLSSLPTANPVSLQVVSSQPTLDAFESKLRLDRAGANHWLSMGVGSVAGGYTSSFSRREGAAGSSGSKAFNYSPAAGVFYWQTGVATDALLGVSHDGAVLDTVADTGFPSSLDRITVGIGAHEESRVALFALTDDWIAYEYANQSDPAGWYTVEDAATGASLTVADATATASADTVAITQVHALTAAGDTAAAGAADAPALTQAHDVLVGTADTAAGAATPAIGQVHAVIAADAAAAPATDAPAVTQVHALSVADATAASAADLVALPTPDEHDLVVGQAVATASADAPAIAQVHTLAAADAEAGAAADAVSVSQTHALSVTGDTAATPGADTVAVSQAHDLVVSAPYVEPGVDVVALLQVHALSVEDAIAAGHADAVAWYAQSLGEIVNPQVVVLTARRDLAAITAARHAAAITVHRTVKRLH